LPKRYYAWCNLRQWTRRFWRANKKPASKTTSYKPYDEICKQPAIPRGAHRNQYDAADPENRLVADELERRWNQALQRVREVELRIEQHVHRHGNVSAAPTREQFEDLAHR